MRERGDGKESRNQWHTERGLLITPDDISRERDMRYIAVAQDLPEPGTTANDTRTHCLRTGNSADSPAHGVTGMVGGYSCQHRRP